MEHPSGFSLLSRRDSSAPNAVVGYIHLDDVFDQCWLLGAVGGLARSVWRAMFARKASSDEGWISCASTSFPNRFQRWRRARQSGGKQDRLRHDSARPAWRPRISAGSSPCCCRTTITGSIRSELRPQAACGSDAAAAIATIIASPARHLFQYEVWSGSTSSTQVTPNRSLSIP